MAVEWKYQPIMKWKQGERIALRKLAIPQWHEPPRVFRRAPGLSQAAIGS